MESPSLPARSGVVRVDRYMQSAVMCTNGKGGTKGKWTDIILKQGTIFA